MNIFRRFVRWAFGATAAPDPGDRAHTPRAEVERIAALWALQNHKAWTRLVKPRFKTDGGRNVWVVESNYGGMGHRIFVTIDDLTGEVVTYDEIHTR